MKLHIYIETEEGGVLIDRSYQVVDGNAPKVELQDIIDDAIKSLKERSCDNGHDCKLSPDDGCKGCDMVLEARRLTTHND